jgi:hypothetical protein
MKREKLALGVDSKNHTILGGSPIFYWKTLLSLVVVATAFILCSCGSISNKKIAYKGPKYPPYEDEIIVYWKEHGVPKDPNTYELIATISGRTTWCGVTKAAFDKELHDWIKEEAAKVGGNAVIIYCGELGSVSECYCYGDVIRFK